MFACKCVLVLKVSDGVQKHITTKQSLRDINDVHIKNNRRSCVSLREHPDVTFAAHDAAVYTTCLRPNRKLILTAILLTFSKTNTKIMFIQKIEK